MKEKQKEEKKILKLYLSLSKKGWKYVVTEISILRDTPKSYEISLGDNRSKMIRKSKLLVPDTKFDSKLFYGYFLWCLPEDKEKGTEILDKKIRKLFKQTYEEVQMIDKVIQSPVEEIIKVIS